MDKKIVNTKKAPVAIGPYVQAVETGNTVYMSGQIGIVPETGELADGLEAQTEQVLKNIDEILKEAGMTKRNIVKTTIFLADINDFVKVNDIYGKYFGEDKPARSCVQVGALPKAALVEIESVAVK